MEQNQTDGRGLLVRHGSYQPKPCAGCRQTAHSTLRGCQSRKRNAAEDDCVCSKTRWSVLPIDIVGWASEGLLALSVAAPPVKTASSRVLCDLAEIAGTDVLPLFRPDGAKPERVCIRRIRMHGETEWQWISE